MPRDILEEGQRYAKRRIAKLLYDDDPESKTDPSGFAKRMAQRTLDEWVRAGLVVRSRNAKGHFEYELCKGEEEGAFFETQEKEDDFF